MNTKIDLGLTGYNELFMDDQSRAESRLPRIHEIPISQIDDFPEHPFKVKLDKDMEQLVQSIQDSGVITPVILRQKADGRYEMVSGHRRKKACELLGLETIRAEIKELSQDQATILMVESNFQRSHISFSEKAFSYKEWLSAIKRQREHPNLVGAPMGHPVEKQKSRDIVAANVGDSKSQVQRYIRLTELLPPLLDMVDAGRIGFRPAVELSYLQKDEQQSLLEIMGYIDTTPTLTQAAKLKDFSRERRLSPAVIESILTEEKPSQRQKISFRAERLRQYIPDNIPTEKTEDYVLKALEYYQRYQERKPEPPGGDIT